MDETQNDPGPQADDDPRPGQGDEGTDHASEFDPAEVENDPSQNPPISELKDLKGG